MAPAKKPRSSRIAISLRSRSGPGAQLVSWLECVRQVSQRFLDSAAPSGVYGGLLVGLDGIVVLLCPLEVACDHAPVRFDGGRRIDQRVGSPGMQLTVQRWRGQLGCHFPEQLVAESPAVGPASFEHPRPHQFGDDAVDVFGVASDHRAKQAGDHRRAR